jgi:hypothetical protein
MLYLAAWATIAYPVQAQFLRQTLLQCPKHALRAATRFRRIGRDHLNAQLLHGPADLGQLFFADLAADFGSKKVMCPPVISCALDSFFAYSIFRKIAGRNFYLKSE